MSWLDLIVAALAVSFGLALAIIVAVEGGSALQVALVVLIFGAATLRWLNTSLGWEPIRHWRDRRSSKSLD